DVAAFGIASFAQPFSERSKQVCELGGRGTVEISDHWHRALLRARRERPRGRAADSQDELAASHSITRSASASSCGGISRPSAFAALRLITSSNFVGCSIGKFAGLAPFNILSTKIAAF